MFASVGFLGEEMESVLALVLEEKPNDGVEVADLLDPSDVYDCARERDAIGTVKLLVESDGPGVPEGDGEPGTCRGDSASAGGIGNPLTAATN